MNRNNMATAPTYIINIRYGKNSKPKKNKITLIPIAEHIKLKTEIIELFANITVIEKIKIKKHNIVKNIDMC